MRRRGPVSEAIAAVRAEHEPHAVTKLPAGRLRRGPTIKPFTFPFPKDDYDWSQANLPVLRAAIGVLEQDGPALVAVHLEATKTDPFYTRRMVGELNQRVAHFELLTCAMRMARDRLETAAAYADAIEAAGS